MRVMILEISPQAEMKISVEGVPGPACKEFTRKVEEGLGTVTGSEATGEMYLSETIALPQEN